MINIASEDGSIDAFEEGRNPALSKFPGDVTTVGSFGPRNVSHLANVVFKLGEKGSGLRPLISSVQDFAQLKKECLDSGLLFADLEFPAQPSSIYGTKKVEEDTGWIRPPEMVSNPEFFVSGASRYSITQVRYVRKETENGENVPLVRVRNPWGNNDEWEGAWSDGSPEWDSISSQEKEELGVKPEFNADGEFWMSLEDVKSHLAFLEVCHLNPMSVIDSNLSRHTKEWVISAFEGEWVRGATAGGPDTDLEKFVHNPQYCITLAEESTVIVALMQKNQRAKAQFAADQQLNFLQTGFTVYPVRFWSRLMKIMKLKGLSPEKLSKPLDLSFLRNIKTKALDIDSATDKSAPRYLKIGWGREVVCRIKLIPGAYCIVPHTKESDEEGEFLLRVFSATPNNMEEYDVQVSIIDVDRKISANESWIEKLREFFKQLAGGDSELDWIEQKKFLDSTMPKELRKEGFNKEICRSIVSMLDLDRSGKLGFHEFKIFWRIITNLEKAFQEIYAETNAVAGMLSTFYLREALERAGYRVNVYILGRLVRRYGTNDQKITFEDFVMCAVRLKTMIGMFKERDLDQTNTVTFAMEELLDTILYS